MIEHVADHDHSALRPLPHTAKIGVAELRLASISLCERAEYGDRGVQAHFVTLCDIGHNAKTLRRQVLHVDQVLALCDNERRLGAGATAFETNITVKSAGE